MNPCETHFQAPLRLRGRSVTTMSSSSSSESHNELTPELTYIEELREKDPIIQHDKGQQHHHQVEEEQEDQEDGGLFALFSRRQICPLLLQRLHAAAAAAAQQESSTETSPSTIEPQFRLPMILNSELDLDDAPTECVQQQQQQQHPNFVSSLQLIVAHVSPKVSDDELRAIFEEFGDVERAQVVTNPRNAAKRGYAFVTFTDPAAAATAIEQLNGFDLYGRNIFVGYAGPRRPKPQIPQQAPEPSSTLVSAPTAESAISNCSRAPSGRHHRPRGSHHRRPPQQQQHPMGPGN